MSRYDEVHLLFLCYMPQTKVHGESDRRFQDVGDRGSGKEVGVKNGLLKETKTV